MRNLAEMNLVLYIDISVNEIVYPLVYPKIPKFGVLLSPKYASYGSTTKIRIPLLLIIKVMFYIRFIRFFTIK